MKRVRLGPLTGPNRPRDPLPIEEQERERKHEHAAGRYLFL